MELVRASRILSKIAEVGPDFVALELGDVGRRLELLFRVLGNHPEADDIFFDECDLELCDLMDLAANSSARGASFLKRRLPAIAEMVASDRLKSAKMPCGGGYAARVLRKPVRDAARATRKEQGVASSGLAKHIRKRLMCCPSGFSHFFTGAKVSPMDVAARTFSGMGCSALLEASRRMAEDLYNPTSVFGYKRLAIFDACSIMAKKAGLPEGAAFKVVPLPLPETLPEPVRSLVEDAEFNRNLLMEPVFDHYLSVVADAGSSVVLGERDGKCYFMCEWNNLN